MKYYCFFLLAFGAAVRLIAIFGLKFTKSRCSHIIRDFNRNSKVDKGDKTEYSIIGANQHSGSDQKFVDNASAGCPVGRTSKGHQEFMSYLHKDVDYQANNHFIFSTGFVQAKSLNF